MITTSLLTISGSILISKIKESKNLLKNTIIISMISLTSIFVIAIVPKRIKNIVEYDASYAEYLPVEVDREYIKQRGIIITSNNNTKHTFKKTGTTMEININQNDNDTYLELPLIYYKGYTAKIEKTNIETFKTENGLLGIKINDIKEAKIKIKYEGTKLSKTTKLISLISFIAFSIYIKEVNYEK